VRAITIQRFGDPDGMVLKDVPVPSPAADEMLIETEAIGVGGVDAVIRRGTLGSGFAIGMVPGSEVAGIVVQVGADVDPVWLGRRVWAFTGTGGGYVEYALARVGDVTPIPDEMSATDAVTIGSAGTVAHLALAHAHLSAGESVLIRGAAGSIGIAAIEHAARAEASTIAVTTSSTERGLRLREYGATEVLDRDGAGGVTDRFDVIIDIVGGAQMPTFIDRLAPNGRLVIVGAVAGFPPADFGMRLMRDFQRSRSVATFSLDSISAERRAAARAEQFAAVARGDLHPVIHSVMPLEEAAAAHREMDAGSVFGRIVLTP
jgi:NADPH2:quinone reductase